VDERTVPNGRAALAEFDRARIEAAASAVATMHEKGLEAARLLDDAGATNEAHEIRLGLLHVDNARVQLTREDH